LTPALQPRTADEQGPHLTAENQARFDKLRIIDSIEFANDRLLPRLTVRAKSIR